MKQFKRLDVKLGDLKPNPFKKEIRNGRLEDHKIQKLMGSIHDNGFWSQLQAREHNGEIQIAFGHHRVAAGIRTLGQNHTTSVEILDLDDAAMLRRLAAENSTNETDSVEAQVDIVLAARRTLTASKAAGQPWCKIAQGKWEFTPTRNPSGAKLRSAKQLAADKQNAEANHVCGSEVCIAFFLDSSGATWVPTRVHETLELGEKLHPNILSDLTRSKTHPEREGTLISIEGARALSALPKESQQQVYAAIQHNDVYVPAAKIRDVVKNVAPQINYLRNVPADNKKETQATVATITYKAVQLTKAVQQDVKSNNHSRDVVKKLSKPALPTTIKPIPEINDIGMQAARRLSRVFTPDDEKELFKWLGILVKYKKDVTSSRRSLEVELDRLAGRVMTLKQQLQTTKQLKGEK